MDRHAYVLRYLILSMHPMRLFSVNQHQVRTLAKRFPAEEHDSFYSHTQRAFSQGNHAENSERTYAFTCKKTDKNRLEVNDLVGGQKKESSVDSRSS